MGRITLSAYGKFVNDMARDKSTLPFEVTYSEKPGSKSRASSPMKRLAVLLKPEKCRRNYLCS
jgi:hypothetical protein